MELREPDTGRAGPLESTSAGKASAKRVPPSRDRSLEASGQNPESPVPSVARPIAPQPVCSGSVETVQGLSPGTAGIRRASLSSGGAAQPTGGIRLPEGPLSSPARRTEVGDKADRGLLAATPCSPSMPTIGPGEVSAGPDSGNRVAGCWKSERA